MGAIFLSPITFRGKPFCECSKKLGVRKGDRVALYLPMIPELAVAVLACARIGAVHSVILRAFVGLDS